MSRLGPKPAEQLHSIVLNGGEPVTVRLATERLLLEASIQFTVVERQLDKFGNQVSAASRYKVSTRGYKYKISDQDELEAISYHWHPGRKGDVDFPHEHLGPAWIKPGAAVTKKAHMRTGRMAFEDVLSNLFQMGATPVNLNWETILDQNRSSFDEWKTWS